MIITHIENGNGFKEQLYESHCWFKTLTSYTHSKETFGLWFIERITKSNYTIFTKIWSGKAIFFVIIMQRQSFFFRSYPESKRFHTNCFRPTQLEAKAIFLKHIITMVEFWVATILISGIKRKTRRKMRDTQTSLVRSLP